MQNDSTSSENETFQPLGFDLGALKQKRKEQIAKHKPVMAQKKEVLDSDLPDCLQYEVLLKRALDQLRMKEEGQDAAKMKLSLDVKREPSSKTSINIVEISKALHRDQEHVMRFIFNELFTTGSVNKEGRLFLKGVFLKSQVQDILRSYVEHFVVCKSCENVENTNIIKQNQLYFLKCSRCGAMRCVGNIIEGMRSKGKAVHSVRGLI
ncbi:subunit beta of translation initiation factor 2 [Hamiltosporidium tvaerminnensis]|uniref:Subunit beta of translation initiation factor 2 n=2 Tax=Hamiltosporidium TaxID=1176354 RepID=A0A4Q9L4J9_9MICR|nr:translation initiation factor eIF-2 beta subunit [Hamiltosporidium tvaerminnensis]TBU02438.1 subunit beta of translation initiation factor 2 [Hamiltosporidium tvaerminnensis]TBU07934.1 subunit beta of translation initiation factor 2 [Hamiltosporidium magnivora]TBU08231.1 subunit beta of translation initiation factor 2 [Hamiltosporidium tvaerminnensis]